jgi:hypothetical protein
MGVSAFALHAVSGVPQRMSSGGIMKAGGNGHAGAARSSGATEATRRRALKLLAGGACAALFGAPARLPAAVAAAFAPPASNDAPAAADDPLISVKSTLAIVGSILSAASMVSPLAGVGGIFFGLFTTLVGLFWPNAGPGADDLWQVIRARVSQLVDSAISDAEFAALQNAIAGLQANLTDYASLQQIHLQLGSAQSLADLRQKYIAVDAFCIGIRPQFLPQGREERFLPLFAAFATLHHMLLQDMVLNGKRYGVEPGLVAGDVAKLQQVVATNGVTFDHHWEGVRFRFINNPIFLGDQNAPVTATRISAPSGNRTYIEDGLYDKLKSAHATFAQLTVLAKDFRDLWPAMGGLRKGPVALTRELWLGPYGKPDALELPGDYSAIRPYDGSIVPGLNVWQRTSGYAAAAIPEPSPLAPPSSVGFDLIDFHRADGDDWRFPAQPRVVRDPGIAMAHGPITRVRVDTGHYVSRGVSGSSASIPAAGHLVAQVYFWHEDGTEVTHGGLATGPGGDGREMKYYVGEDVAIPSSHVLSGMHVCTRVNNLYHHLGANSLSSIGSIMFGFRLKDPSLAPTPALLVHLAATHPLGLDVDALLGVAAASAAANGRRFDEAARASLRATLSRELSGVAFADRRAAFRARLEGRAHG